ncbi:MAG: alpha-L-fucosidase, partial [Planctomycetes bacterium]|nr:alpha-L-fucosidase [Planctomycetota bacterium]
MTLSLLVGGLTGCSIANSGAQKTDVPSYLRGYEAIYAEDPREAAKQWFDDADFGLFIHYGLYSLL